jgi:DUF4097 and DUF4098 domain-containing protein YvlB
MNEIYECYDVIRIHNNQNGTYSLFNTHSGIEMVVNLSAYKIFQEIYREKTISFMEIIRNLKEKYELENGISEQIKKTIEIFAQNKIIHKHLIISCDDNYINKKRSEYDFQEIITPIDNKLDTIKIIIANGIISLHSTDSSSIISSRFKYMRRHRETNLISQFDKGTFSIQYDIKKISNLEMDITLPQRIFNLIDVRNMNGTINIDGISSNQIIAYTVNGDVNLQCMVEQVNLESQNGQIHCIIDKFIGYRENSSLVSSNGNIHIFIPKDPQIGYKFNIYNNTDSDIKINDDHGLLNTCHQEFNDVMLSPNYEKLKNKCVFNILTSNGNILIN